MSIQIQQGSWGKTEGVKLTLPEEPSFLPISVVAFLAISSLIAGGCLLHFNVNKIAAYSLLGGGGGALLVDAFVGGGLLYDKKMDERLSNLISKAKDSDPQITYLVVSWNVATLGDYSNMCFIKNKMKNGSDFSDAYHELSAGASYEASTEERAARANLFEQAFQQFGNPDIICLQESWEMKPQELEAMLPEGYSAFSYENGDGRDCTIVWNSAKFSKINHAKMHYDAEYIPTCTSAPDTIALLRDNTNGTTICVGSAHLRGFSLAYETFNEMQRGRELKSAKTGDHQARYDLETMEAVQADLYIFAGDFNVTQEHYPARLDIIRSYGYISDSKDFDPTIYDANLKESDGETPKPAKLDHIFVKAKEQSEVQIRSVDLLHTTLNDFNRPSDHLPIAAEISYR